MKVVYIAHPLNAPTREGIEENRRNATAWVGWAADQGVAPVADWIILSGLWAESPEKRSRGLGIDCAIVMRCEEVWLVGGRVSPGMQTEADVARSVGIKVVDLTNLGALPPC